MPTQIAPAERFETIYTEAHGERERVPWGVARPSPALVVWLNQVAPSLVRCGARVAVVGCGLGDDAAELARRGYEVTAFDISPTAIAWAQREYPEYADAFHVADLFAIPARWRHRFDLVVEINTVQALEPSHRVDTLRAIAELVSPRGHLLVICRQTEAPVSEESEPPWPLTREELETAARGAGLTAEGAVTSFLDHGDPPVARLRGVFRH